MELYDNYLKYFDKTPNQQYREDMQEFVDESWDNDILLDDIILEDEPRTFIYDNNDIKSVKIDSVAEISTNLAKIEGNYISVLFKDCSFEYNRGSMFYRPSIKSYYIVYQSTNAMRTTAKCKAIQCNNIIKWVDVSTKKIIEYPCSMGQELSSTTSQDLKFVSVANGRTVVIVFGNEFTRRLELNQRLIFNGVPYRINAIKNYEEDNYENRSVDLLFLYLEKSSIEPTDDYIRSIANFNSLEYLVTPNINELIDVKGTNGTLTAKLTCNGEEIIDPRFKWFSSNEDVIKVDNKGNYKIVGEVGDTATITCLYVEDIKSEITVEVSDSAVEVAEIRIIPTDDYIEISKGSYKEFKAYLYINNEKQIGDNISYNYNFVNDCYSVVDIEDGIKIICNKPTTERLEVTFSNNTYSLSKVVTIKLKGVW